MRASEAGFSLIEVLIAAALFVVVAFGALESVRELLAATQHLAARHLAYAGLERFDAQLRAEARAATAIDVAGSAAPGAGACVQVDFFSADASGPHFWSYRNFPGHPSSAAIPGDAIERLAGSAPIPACDATAAGTIVARNVRMFAAETIPAAALPRHVDPYLGSGAPDSGFVGPNVADGAVPLGVEGAHGELQGGNALVELRVANDDAVRVIDVVPGVFPTGFTVQLQYQCDARCTVGHGGSGPDTITACGMTWRAASSGIASWTPQPPSPTGAIVLVPRYWVAGYFSFTYSGVAPNGATDTVVHEVMATNYGQTPADGTHGTPMAASAPDLPIAGAAVDAWYQAFAPYVVDAGPYSGSMMGFAALQAERQRCAQVDAEGQRGGYSYD